MSIRVLTGTTIGEMSRTLFPLLLFVAVLATQPLASQDAEKPGRPNILFAIADDWGWPHAAAYGDAVVKTPSFDRIAAHGMMFDHAYVSSPSCTPSRGAILTGKYHWLLGPGANLYGTFRDDLTTYVEILSKTGYAAGCTGKAWGPGRPQTRGRPLAGKRHKNFGAFLKAREGDKPFVFWLGTSDPHRPFKKGSGKKSGMDLSKVHMFGHYPDVEEIRSDVADYYFEVQRFDRLVGNALNLLEASGELKNTIVVMTGDHGMPFPRCKSNVYDAGMRVPLAIMWGDRVATPGRTSKQFVSLTDLAPTFLEAAGVAVPKDMTGRSLMKLLTDPDHEDPRRSSIIFGKERHVPSQEAPNMGGYPCRAIRTHRYLYIVNYSPDRWPNGTPNFEKAAMPGNWYADTDNSPTKTYIIANKDKDDVHRRAYELCFAKRPAEEFYDLKADKDQLRNLASDPKVRDEMNDLTRKLASLLAVCRDPRSDGKGDQWDHAKYTGGGPKHPSWRKKKQRRKK
jgi:arylsulfatase A-like enzyme